MKKILSLYILMNTFNPIFANPIENEYFYQKMLTYAPKTVGLTRFPKINNFRYNGDCSGFIAFLFHLAGLNLLKLYGIGDSGVSAIWDGLSKQNFILDHQELQVGDILFFDNTYDKNKNGRWDDDFSHIGVVESVDEYKTVTYLHYGSRGVVRAKMNLKHPTTYSATKNGQSYRYNDLLRASKKRGVNPKYLSGSLYRGAARIIVQKNN
ncbi:MAG: CHAP domain-containing protein [Brevinema sp.]